MIRFVCFQIFICRKADGRNAADEINDRGHFNGNQRIHIPAIPQKSGGIHASCRQAAAGIFIPTPMGNYIPDWAIVFKDVKHIYFIAETKGSMESMELREVGRRRLNVHANTSPS
ncbi:hypothetical protein [Paenibacillus ginsengihumi]|uniref:restriction endonuclease n=1 Tax=Paenibacillus ginsengihumi TaxID=431596 RepID=UPI00037D01F2|nr:hypothetical protein [Paenibacillus ginsengihumi]